MRKLEKKKGRYIWAGAAILILMVAAGVFGLSLHAQVRAVPVIRLTVSIPDAPRN